MTVESGPLSVPKTLGTQPAPPVQAAPPPMQPAPQPVQAAPPPPPPPAPPPPPPVSFPEPVPAPAPGHLVDVHPLQYTSFDDRQPAAPVSQRGLGLVYDIPLQVSVELGKTKKEISEILDFGLGTVLVLDKMAGEPVEILVNGKLIARGEVVVIDDNYGVRITEVLNG